MSKKVENFCSFCDHFDPESCDCQLIDGLSERNQKAGICTKAHIAGHSVEMHQATIEAEDINGNDLTIRKYYYRGQPDGLSRIIRRLETGR